MTDDPECGHCGRPITTAARGWAADGTVLCHTGTIPPSNDPPDCFKLCTVYEHAPDGSCCRDQKPPPWKSLRHVPDDFAACSYGSECWRTGTHSLKPRECDYAERAAPEFGYWRTFDPGDGCMSLAMATIPLAAVLPWVETLTVDQQHQMLEEAAEAENPAACVEEWRRTVLSSADTEQVDLRFSPGEMRDLRRIAREQGVTVDELIREWLRERLQPAQPSLNTPGVMLSINMGTTVADPPRGINMGIVGAMYEQGRRQGRYEAGG